MAITSSRKRYGPWESASKIQAIAARSASPAASAAISNATAERRAKAAQPATAASTSEVQTAAPGGSMLHTSVSRAPEPPSSKSAPSASASSQQEDLQQEQPRHDQHRLVGRRAPALADGLQADAEDQRRGGAGDQRVHRHADGVAQAQLREHDADREHDGAGRDQRPAVRRRAEEVEPCLGHGAGG